MHWLRCLSCGHWESIKTMITDQRAAHVVNATDAQGRTALMQAVCARRPDVVQALLTLDKLRINATDHEGNTALLLAAYVGDDGLVDVLCSADINAADHQGDTALIVAANNAHLHIVTRLLQLPAIDINIANKCGLTALHCAALADHSYIVDALLNSDCIDVNAVDENEHSALMLAAASGNLESAELLRNDPRCNVNLRDGENKTAAMFAQDYAALPDSLPPRPSQFNCGPPCLHASSRTMSHLLHLRCCSTRAKPEDSIPLVVFKSTAPH